MYDLLGEPYHGHDEHDSTEAICELQSFWGFTLSGGASLEEVARFYGLSVPGLEPGTTLTAYLSRNGGGSLHPGYCVTVGGVDLLVLETENGVVRRVGLKLRPAGVRRPQRRSRRQYVGA